MTLQVSDEAERSLLVKLKTECGYQFTSKLESMFTDIKTSRDTMQDYKASRRAAGSSDESEIDLSVQARTLSCSSLWSLQQHVSAASQRLRSTIPK